MCSGDYVPERFSNKEKIGEGAYGIVIKAYDRQRNTEVALKKIKNV
jgi:serine/threonine protein kinase